MIGRLRGELLEKHPPQLLMEVGGVGYELEASMNTFYRLPERGKQVTLYTHFVVREDAQLLYGFVDRGERSLFRALIKVNGVGPKMALGILGADSDPLGAADLRIDSGHRQATLFTGFAALAREDLRVDVDPRIILALTDVEHQQPPMDIDLGRGQADASGGIHGRVHVPHQFLQFVVK